jgi:hypothetical protein
MFKLRRILNKITDKQIEKLFQVINKDGLLPDLKKIVQNGDMDLQLGVIKAAFLNPKIIASGLSILGSLKLLELIDFVNL